MPKTTKPKRTWQYGKEFLDRGYNVVSEAHQKELGLYIMPSTLLIKLMYF
ncbi:MAG: hypothetical protein KZQ74_03340 [gamma proteobacterium symbiont of Bathyaustriella thionipta]|nr:hypothetical protein [gamma proteobacterium symbiont of Bathyaustriella thionipta]MCU7956032.1 hypothetical protein [gamma proteobacterium symbiont of Bathyaustriella thionipta]MCU7966220.1 hypothetical protein [gamma proteobacterium symbiont of Bathyaustriella thionipta]